jgi:hypothetical protein
MTLDEIHTEAVKALALMGGMENDDQRECYMQALLFRLYQEGKIAANWENIARNQSALDAIAARVKSI